MPSCIVKGCNFSWKNKDPNIILHSFPGDLGAIRSWLLATAQATKQELGNVDELCQKILVGKPKGLYRMCSQHFTMDCYYQRGMLISLKKEALPTIFPDKETIELKALRPKTYKPRKRKTPSPDPTLVGRGGVPTSMVMGLPLRVIKLEQEDPVPLTSPCLISEHGYYIPHGDLCGQRRLWNSDSNGSRGEILSPQKKTRTLGTNTEYFPGQRHKSTLTDKNIGVRHKEVQTEKIRDDPRPCSCKQDEESRLANHLHSSVRTMSTEISQSKALLINAQSLPTGSTEQDRKDRTLDLPPHRPSGTGSLSNINHVLDISACSRSTETKCVLDVGCSHSWAEVKKEKTIIPDTEQNLGQGSGYSSVKQECGINEKRAGEPGVRPNHMDLARVEIPGTSNPPDPSSENKYIVFDSCLNKLLTHCRCLAEDSCNGRIAKFKKFFVGSSVSVKAECSNGHRFHMWDSQP